MIYSFSILLFSFCLTRMRSNQDMATIVLDPYDILYAGDKNDAVVSTGRRRQFSNRYGFCFSTTLWTVLEIALHVSVMFSPLQTLHSNF